MGFIKNTVSGLLGTIMGGQEKPAPAPTKQPVEESKSASQIAEEEEAKRKAALIAANAGSSTPGYTVGGGAADVTRKVLLGL